MPDNKIDEISQALGKIEAGIASLHGRASATEKKIDFLHKAAITSQLNHDAVEGRVTRFENEFNDYKKKTEDRIKPLETFNKGFIWVRGVVYSMVAIIFSVMINKLFGFFG